MKHNDFQKTRVDPITGAGGQQEVLLWEPKAKYVELASPVYVHTSMKVPYLESLFDNPPKAVPET